MRVVISDTNIFIDLLSVNLLDAFLELPIEIQTTDFVLMELNKEQLSIIESKITLNIIQVNSADENELEEIVTLQRSKPTLSIEDFSVFYFAQKKSATILTGDKAFRTFAEKKKMDVKGVLWIFDEIEKSSIIKKKDLAESLEKLTKINSRLPKEECQKRITSWRK